MTRRFFLHLRTILHSLWRFFVFSLLLLCLLLTLLYASVFYLAQNHAIFQANLSNAIGHTVAIDSLESFWENWTPVVKIGTTEVRQHDSGLFLFGFQQAEIRLDLAASLLHGQLITRNIVLNGGNFTVIESTDGQISLKGFALPEDANPLPVEAHKAPLDNAQQKIRHWFLQQQNIRLTDTRLLWLGQKRPSLPITQLNLYLEKAADTYAMRGHLSLPPIRYPAPLLAGSGLDMQGGSFAFDANTVWQAQHLKSLQGKIQLQHLTLHSRNNVLQVQDLFVRLRLQAMAEQGWLMAVQTFLLNTGQHRWPVSQMQLEIKPQQDYTQVLGKIGFLDLQEVFPLLGGIRHLPDKIREILVAVRPGVQLHNMQFRFNPKHWHIKTRFSNWQHHSWAQIPGFKSVSGQLMLDTHGGMLQLESKDVELDAPMFADKAFKIKSLLGKLHWHKTKKLGEGWLLHFEHWLLNTANIQQLGLQGTLFLPTNAAKNLSEQHSENLSTAQNQPRIDLSIQIKNADLSHIYQYIPLKIKAARKWLRSGLVTGSVSGDLKFKGLMQVKNLFHQKKGKNGFYGSATVIQAKIDYAPGWPALKQITTADLQVDGDNLYIHGNRGKVHRNTIYDTRVNITGMSRGKSVKDYPLLQVDGHVRGRARDMLGFLQNSPLRGKTGTQDLDISDRLDLALKLDIPLENPHTLKVDGKINLQNNTLQNALLRQQDLAISALKGQVFFQNNGLQAHNLSGNLLDAPVRMNLLKKANAGLNVELMGPVHRSLLNNVWQAFDLPLDFWLKTVSGESQWQANLFYPETASLQAPSLEINTDLQGLQIDLPAPLGKMAQQTRPFQYQQSMAKGLQEIRAKYSSLFNLALKPKHPGISIQLGKQAAKLNNFPGIQIQGYWPQLSLDDLYGLWQQAAQSSPVAQQSSTTGDTKIDTKIDIQAPRYWDLDLKLNQLTLAQTQLHHVHLKGAINPIHWTFNFLSDEAGGKLKYLPRQADFQLNFDFIRLPADNDSQQDAKRADSHSYLKQMETLSHARQSLDPRKLPELTLICQSLWQGETSLGRWELLAKADSRGLDIYQIHAQHPDFEMNGKARWDYQKQSGLSDQADTHLTTLKLQFDSPSLGQALKHLDYGKGALQGGKSQINLDVNWPGHPLQLSMAHVRGHLNLDIGSGTLITVDPGVVGHLIGLLDFASIAQRLSQDLQNVVSEGFAFQQILGRFFIEGGYAYTDGLQIQGVAADVHIAGRTGLLNQTYDQDMILYPHLSNALPIAGMVVGGPVVGTGVFVFQNLFKGQLKQGIQRHYKISGSWEKPVVKAKDITQ
ncbi:DUF3971 domain-containing protein [Candidatus Venteria ishoeyi]|uniref:YhdP family phospholipid transporter n=1 Tax=Candidatus Venteria ishoeyi TaxID=1899563 RepID=UPI0025A4CC96|nr:AsmA-like C-terminal region-containing protein [Candidatus Venteria ishoeyi]MDM8545307.1 DUF3971 domain-containing protein [Candidatus Venteria ishoeyi]